MTHYPGLMNHDQCHITHGPCPLFHIDDPILTEAYGLELLQSVKIALHICPPSSVKELDPSDDPSDNPIRQINKVTL